MRVIVAFLKKEMLECFRSGKLFVLLALFCCFGIMNPAVAKLTPWLLSTLSDQLAENGMTVTEVSVNALTSWVQFFKNIPMALIVFVIIYSSSFTKEYSKGTLNLVLTKGVSRYKVVLAKTTVILFLWSVGYFLCFGITYAYNAFFWDNSIANELGVSAIYWWLFGIWVACGTVLFSVLFNSASAVLLGTGGMTVVAYVISLFPTVGRFSPASLMDAAIIPSGAKNAEELIACAIIAAVLSMGAVCVSIPIMNKKQL